MEEKYLTNLVSPNGESDCHKKYAKQSKTSIVELGVLFGETSKLLLDNSECIVYGIDPIIPDSMNVNLIGNIDKINKLVEEYKDRFLFFKDYSHNVVKNWNQLISYLFIDANHVYESVKKDFEDWFPFVEQGGIISIHDSTANRGGPHWWSGPSQLADELILDNRVEYIESFGVLTVFRKR